jgi:hypothetical protein
MDNGQLGTADRTGGAVRTFLIRPLVVVLALITLALCAKGALDTAADGARVIRDPRSAPGANTKHQWDKIRQEMADQIPRGSRIYCCGTVPTGQGWEHRILAFALINDTVVVSDRADADTEISIVIDRSVYTGVRLVVAKLR